MRIEQMWSDCDRIARTWPWLTGSRLESAHKLLSTIWNESWERQSEPGLVEVMRESSYIRQAIANDQRTRLNSITYRFTSVVGSWNDHDSAQRMLDISELTLLLQHMAKLRTHRSVKVKTLNSDIESLRAAIALAVNSVGPIGS